MSIKRLYFDIETSPNIGFFWQPGNKISISYENIIKERAIICICYKWSNSNKVYSLQWDEKQNDKKMLQEFVKVSEQADELVGHNGDNYDIKWIRTRCLFHGISMMPNYTTIDTLKESRKLFRFNSNRLDYISKFIGLDGKTTTSYDLWKDITLKNCKKSIGIMVRYCKNDVVQLEQMFNKMNQYIKPKSRSENTHYKSECPECGSENVKMSGTKTRATGSKVQQFQCNDCGKWHSVPYRVFQLESARKDKAKTLKNGRH